MQLQKFLTFIESKDTLSPAQRDVCIYIFQQTSSIINQVARRYQTDGSRLTLEAITNMVFRLMSHAHKFVAFSGEDKKEIVTFTILGGLSAHGIEIPLPEQEMIEQTIDLIWWASHNVVFAVKKRCSKLCGGAPGKHDAAEPLQVEHIQPTVAELKRAVSARGVTMTTF